jgi:cbb3-type cytochrome oxidase cytochrome c subunit
MNILLVSTIGLLVLIILRFVLFNPEKLSRIARSSGPHPYSRWALLIFSIFVAEGCFAMACYVAGIRIVYSFAFLLVSLIAFGLWSITTRFWSR